MSDADPNLVTALWELHLSGRSDEALSTAQAQLAPHPEHVSMRLLVAAIQQHQGDWQAAGEHLQQVLLQVPEQHNARHDLAICLHQLGQPLQALQHYQALSGVITNNPDLHFNMALSLQACGELSAAIAQLMQAVSIAPERLDAQVRLAYLYRLCCMWPQAEAQRDVIRGAINQAGDRLQAHAASTAPYELIVAQVGEDAHAHVAHAHAQSAVHKAYVAGASN